MTGAIAMLSNILSWNIIREVDGYMSLVKITTFLEWSYSQSKTYAHVWLNFKNEYHRDYGLAAFIVTNGGEAIERWYKNGKLHRNNDLPAEIEYDLMDSWWEEPSIITVKWYWHGKLHRLKDGPAFICYDPKDAVEQWYQNGVLHRTGGPAEIRCYEDYYFPPYGPHTNMSQLRIDEPHIHKELWYCHGKLSREDGPTHIEYSENGTKKLEIWYQDGEWSRDGGPAYIEYDDSGTTKYEEWYSHGEFIWITLSPR